MSPYLLWLTEVEANTVAVLRRPGASYSEAIPGSRRSKTSGRGPVLDAPVNSLTVEAIIVTAKRMSTQPERLAVPQLQPRPHKCGGYRSLTFALVAPSAPLTASWQI